MRPPSGWPAQRRIQGLLTAEQVEAFGFEKDDQINAALVLRGNGDNRMRMSLAMGATLKDLGSLLHVVLVMKSGSTLEADVRVGGQVEAILDSLEFTEAADFPTLTEYRLGQTSGIGDGDGVHLLSWV